MTNRIKKGTKEQSQTQAQQQADAVAKKLISTKQACELIGKSRFTLLIYQKKGIIQPWGNSPHHQFDAEQLLADVREFKKGKYHK